MTFYSSLPTRRVCYHLYSNILISISLIFLWTRLNVKLTTNTALLYKMNFCPLLSKMRMHLQFWQALTHIWFGRCNAFKMTMLPQIFYLMQAILIKLPQAFFLSCRTMIVILWYFCLNPWGELGCLIWSHYRAVHFSSVVSWCISPK